MLAECLLSLRLALSNFQDLLFRLVIDAYGETTSRFHIDPSDELDPSPLVLKRSTSMLRLFVLGMSVHR
jgi:hypothetical protein